MEKKTWFRSDIWPLTAVLLLAALVTAAIVGYDAVLGTVDGGTARTAIIGGLVLAAGIALGMVDRAEAMRREAIFRTPSLDESQRWATRLSKEMDAPSDPEDADTEPPKAA